MAVRQAALADSDAIFDLERYAYDYPSDHVKLVKNNFEKTFEEYYVMEEEKQIVGAGRLICFDQNIRNSWKKIGGLGELATSPVIRRKGHAREMMTFGIELMYQNGLATRIVPIAQIDLTTCEKDPITP